MQYRLNEAVGRPFDSSVNGARMIGSGVFDRHPNLQVLIVHMGGELASVLGRLEFTWRLNYKGIRNPPAGRPYKNERPPSDYFKTNIAQFDNQVLCLRPAAKCISGSAFLCFAGRSLKAV